MATLSALLHYYRFDCGKRTIDSVLADWSEFDPHWVKLAIVEAIYRGRYKAQSVYDILRFWQRRGEPCYRFSHEFERSICGDFVFVLPQPKPKYPPLSLPSLNWNYMTTSPFEERLRALTSSPNYCS